MLGWATAHAAMNSWPLVGQGSGSDMDKMSPPVEELLHIDVFKPLGMKDTSFWVPLEKRDSVAVPAKGVPTMIDWDFTSTFNPYQPELCHLKTSAGGMYTTANDLVKFVNRVLLSP